MDRQRPGAFASSFSYVTRSVIVGLCESSSEGKIAPHSLIFMDLNMLGKAMITVPCFQCIESFSLNAPAKDSCSWF